MPNCRFEYVCAACSALFYNHDDSMNYDAECPEGTVCANCDKDLPESVEMEVRAQLLLTNLKLADAEKSNEDLVGLVDAMRYQGTAWPYTEVGASDPGDEVTYTENDFLNDYYGYFREDDYDACPCGKDTAYCARYNCPEVGPLD